MSRTSSNISRRWFLAGAGAATAAFGLPCFVPGGVLSAPGQPGANDRINLGIIGNGKMMNGSHLPHFLKMPEVQVVVVCDVDQTRREAAAAKAHEAYGNTDCRALVDYREILSRDDIDAVAIATPDHWHGTIILHAAQAGKDIYCEKPLTNTILEAKRTMDGVKKSGVIFQTGSQQRASDNFRYACELVRNGRIGKIKQVLVDVGGPSRPCDLPEEEMEPGLDWDRWLGPAPMRPYNSVLSPRGMHNHFPAWRHYREYGGGGMTDWGAHHFDIAQWGLGMDESGPVEIIAPEDPSKGKGVRFLYAGGVELVHDGVGGVTFIGDEGEIFVNRGKLRSTPESIIKKPIGDDEIHLYRAPGDSHSGHREDWIQCVRQRKQPNCPVEIGARSVTVCLLGNLVYWHGRSLRWDPQKWEFPGDAEANSWLDYPYPRREGCELPTV
ncbi:MAG: Gfo/Idh/MocA family protein [Planctomycetota bacterium]